MIKNQLFIAAALFVGVAIGYFVRSDSPRESAVEANGGYVAKAKIADNGAAASLGALKARVAELERLLAAKSEAMASVPDVSASTQTQQRVEGGGWRPPSMKEMRERMERMAKDDPQRFAQITNRMAHFRQRQRARVQANLDFLSSIDTSTMTAEQREAHETYQNLIVQREEQQEALHNPETSDEDREAAMRSMWETERALRDASQAERSSLISQAVQGMGFSGDDAALVTSTLNDIITSTETGRGGPPPHGGPPPGGRP